MKNKLQTERKHLQTTYPTKDLYQEYITNLKFNSKEQTKNNSPIRKWTDNMNRGDTNGKSCKKMFDILTVGEMQIKTTMKYQYTSI